jgi:competence transcription factor ComK
MDINETPIWLQYAILLFGGSGIVWTVWSKFGESIKSFVTVKNDIKSGSLENESLEIDMMAKYKSFLNKEMEDLMVKYVKLKEQVDRDHKKLTEQMKADRIVLERQRNYIKYQTSLLIKHKIDHEPFQH